MRAGRGGKAPCRQTIWRRKKKEQERREKMPVEPVVELEEELLGGDESNEEEEQNAGAQEDQEVINPMEDLNEEAPNEEDHEDNEDDEDEDLAEAIGCWPVLSKYQSTRFKYQILTNGKF